MEEGSGCKSLSFSETTRRDQLRDYRAHVTRLINGKLKYVRVIMFYLKFRGVRLPIMVRAILHSDLFYVAEVTPRFSFGHIFIR